ncbi:unnamed protein product [Rotaria sordida]|uniref:Symplekin C-terminal domain-containing protein n=1 Tax=Rotaria sordida TaxID=392033 RepID=A0A814R349_9BILA|nr:unnamed protein product [Rotaria sordida]
MNKLILIILGISILLNNTYGGCHKKHHHHHRPHTTINSTMKPTKPTRPTKPTDIPIDIHDDYYDNYDYYISNGYKQEMNRILLCCAWKQTRIWDGFIKCCEQTRPHSFPILLRLPPSQLKHILQIKSELRDGLVRYLRSMSIAQRSSIPSSILIVIEDDAENIAPISSSNPV